MGNLINILFLSLGFFAGIISKKVMQKILDTRKMIKDAEEIMEIEKKRKEFKEKYDIEID